MNCAKPSTPSRSSDPVSRKMRIPAASVWNQVPLAERAFPTKYGPKSRLAMRRAASRGPTEDDTRASYRE